MADRHVLEWVICLGYREGNPAVLPIAPVLPKLPRTASHHKALPCHRVPGVVRTIRESVEYNATRTALGCPVLSTFRSGRMCPATWDEVDLPAAFQHYPHHG